MVELKFKLDKKFLAYYVISNHGGGRMISYAREKYKSDLVTFQNLAWERSREMSRLMDGRLNFFEYSQIYKEGDLSDLSEEVNRFLDELVNTEEFQHLENQTEESVELCKREWDSNFEETSNYVSGLGIELEGEIDVYMFHPGLKAGRSFPDSDAICWSRQTYWSNYNTVYLWHEVLHKYFGRSDEEHAILELIADEEMRSMLNGDEYPPYAGHKTLEPLKDQYLDDWRNFLSSDNKNIKEFVNTIKSKGG